MAKNAAQLLVAGDQQLCVAPVGTAAPVDATAALNAAFIELGFIDEAGPTLTPSITATDLNASNSDYPLRTIISAKTLEIAAPLYQWTEKAVEAAFGGGTFTGTLPDRTYAPPALSAVYERALTLTGIDGTDAYRFYFPKVTVSDVGAIALRKDAASLLSITWRTLRTSGVDPFTLFIHNSDFSAT